jgi:uncharacterized protein (TIGR03085 family)
MIAPLTRSHAMPPLSRTERAALVDLLEEVGPDAPTLCEGWTTRDLAAHLALRERSPAAIGIQVAPLSGLTDRVQDSYAERPWPELVELVRSGPPPWSVFAIPKVERAANKFEMFVHHEDVRRAQPGWEPRVLPDKVQDSLWSGLGKIAKLWLRSTPGTLVLRRPDGSSITVGSGEGTVTVTGEPAELALFAAGRQAHARVELEGDPADVARVRGADFGT